MLRQLMKSLSVFLVTLFLVEYGNITCHAQTADDTVAVADTPNAADLSSPYVRDFNQQMKGNPNYNSCVLDCYSRVQSCRCEKCSKVCNGGTRDFGQGPVNTFTPLSPSDTTICMNKLCQTETGFYKECTSNCAKNSPASDPNDVSPFLPDDKWINYGDPYANNDVIAVYRWAQDCRRDRCQGKAAADLSACMEKECRSGYDNGFASRDRIKGIQ